MSSPAPPQPKTHTSLLIERRGVKRGEISLQALQADRVIRQQTSLRNGVLLKGATHTYRNPWKPAPGKARNRRFILAGRR